MQASKARILIDWLRSVRYAPEWDKIGFFCSVTRVLPMPTQVGHHAEAFAVPDNTPLIGQRPKDNRKSKTAKSLGGNYHANGESERADSEPSYKSV